MEIFPFLQNFKKRIFLILLFIFGLSVGRFSSSIVERFIESGTDLVQKSVQVTMKRNVNLFDNGLVLKRNIFGAASQTPSEMLPGEGVGSSSVIAGDSDLQICGTVFSVAAPLAVIRSNRETGIYREGDALPGGGRVEQIFRNRVVVIEKGKTVVLILDDADATPALIPKESRPTQGVRELGGDRWVIDRKMAESARENIGELLKSARIEPNVQNGRTDGFVVKMIRSGSLLAQVGLRVGDVIRSVNGLELDSPEKALQIFQQLREAKNLSLHLERNGTPLSFEYQIN